MSPAAAVVNTTAAQWGRAKVNAFAATIVFVLLTLSLSAAFWVNEHQNEVSCENQKDNRQVITQVVILATEPSPAGALDFTAVPGFSNVDPETQAYLIALGTALDGRQDDEPSIRDRLLAAIPPITC